MPTGGCELVVGAIMADWKEEVAIFGTIEGFSHLKKCPTFRQWPAHLIGTLALSVFVLGFSGLLN
jgi:hypothetical protein